ncbi:MAG: BACON domain-containing protein, partial [Alistipes sp.]|nr:BACON domain-containing protein [Alistipes sp.]
MRRFFTLCMLLVASMIAMLVACEETPNVEVPKPELKLLSNPMLLFEEQGGEGEIRYSLKNASEGVTLKAEADVDWVSDIVVAEVITFVVAANDVEETRSASIVVSYDALEFKVDLR